MEGLKTNLLSINQFCDNDLVVQFSKKECNIIWNKATIDDSELWHQRLGHLNFTDMLKIVSKEIVKDLPKMEKIGKGVYGPCQLGKQTRAAHKQTSGILTSWNFELLHMDLIGPNRTASLGGRKYILVVVVDDYSRFTWAILLRKKSNAFDAAQQLFKKIQIEQNNPIMRIWEIMGENLRMPNLKNSATHMAFSKSFQPPLLLNRMGL
jgi:hypothetical protein